MFPACQQKWYQPNNDRGRCIKWCPVSATAFSATNTRMHPHASADAEALLELYLEDASLVTLTLDARLSTGRPVVMTADDAEVLATYLLSLSREVAEDVLASRVRQCKTLNELVLSEECGNASLVKNIQRMKEALLPVDRAIYSTESCVTCKKKTVFYVAPQVQARDEEQAFFAVCTNCHGQA